MGSARLGYAAAAVACAVTMAWMTGCGGAAFTVEGSGDGSTDGTIPEAGEPDTSSPSPDAEPMDAPSPDAAREDASQDAEPSPVDAAEPRDGPNDAASKPDASDAALPHCDETAFTCAPAIPLGWTGPFELYAGAQPPASCSVNFQPAYSGNSDLTAGPATCGCACGAPQNVQCSSVDVSFFVGPTCGISQACADKTLSPSVCTPVDTTGPCNSDMTFMRVGDTTPTGGSCTPNPTATIPPPSWAVAARACSSTLGNAPTDCPGAGVCTPIPAAPFQTSTCISQVGLVVCPASYTTLRTFYGSDADTRACSACTCGSVTGATCTGSMGVSTASTGTASCTAGTVIYAVPTTCDPVQQPGDFRLTATASDGQCAPSDSAPTGAATPTQPTTFCCLP